MEQNWAVKGRIFKGNVRLIRTVIEGVEDEKEAMLIKLCRFKIFNRVEHHAFPSHTITFCVPGLSTVVSIVISRISSTSVITLCVLLRFSGLGGH